MSTYPRSGVVNPPMWSAGQAHRSGNVLFGPNSTDCISHVFTVDTLPLVIQAYGLANGECVQIEMVTGCGAGDEFAPLKYACGCCATLCDGRNTLVIPWEGRYRARLTGCSLGDVRVIAYPTTVEFDYGSLLSMCCGSTPTPVTINSPNGTITVSGANPNFGVDVQPVTTAAAIANNTSAVQILCNAFDAAGCFPAAVATHAPATLASPDGSIIVSAAGADNQAFSAQVNPSLLHNPAAISSSNAMLTVGQSGQSFTLGFNVANMSAPEQAALAAMLCDDLVGCGFGAGGLTSVSRNAPLTGNGTAGSPLDIDFAQLSAADIQAIVTAICATPAAKQALAACLISTQANNGISTGSDGLLYGQAASGGGGWVLI